MHRRLNIRRSGLLVATLALALFACRAPRPLTEAEIAAGTALSSVVADRFQAQLIDRLQETIASDGMVAAIHVCAEEAPAIAGQLSAETGATVRRTALRNRNPAAVPDGLEAAVMAQWEGDPLEPGSGRPRRHSVVERDGGGERLRFLRAIPAAPQCLACHGPADMLAPEIRAAIAERYPEDRATGFAAGDLRGAFSITWTAEALRGALARGG